MNVVTSTLENARPRQLTVIIEWEKAINKGTRFVSRFLLRAEHSYLERPAQAQLIDCTHLKKIVVNTQHSRVLLASKQGNFPFPSIRS
jgi:hypothetical protein